MANPPDLSIELHPVGGDARPLSQFLTTFPMAAVVLDPFTHESSWLLDTARRILGIFSEADVRIKVIAISPRAIFYIAMSAERLEKKR